MGKIVKIEHIDLKKREIVFSDEVIGFEISAFSGSHILELNMRDLPINKLDAIFVATISHEKVKTICGDHQQYAYCMRYKSQSDAEGVISQLEIAPVAEGGKNG